MLQSMSRVGHCIDSGPTKGFWGILKSEICDLQTFKNEKSLRSAIEEYIHFYNYKRFQERFENRPSGSEPLNSDYPIQYPIPVNKRIQKHLENSLHKETHRYLTFGNGESIKLLFSYFPGLP